jgi:hypothetical protein
VETKWFMIAFMVIFSGMFGAAAFSEYSRHQCKMEFAQSTRTVAEIEQICK